ncbi:MAG: hypothetical protein OXT65_01570 [Alphaproteobacteria bacterium]|nr:hypothetical protein [Alphaproteobacteria bacterium]
MALSDPNLWDRLRAFQLDDAKAALTFSARLARENNWTHDYALRVVEEYKKFTYLACTSKHKMPPSDEVDQAWHLHLLYTYSYWGEFCNNVLQKKLHHGPTKGGKTEGEKFLKSYVATKALYKEEFGTEPPKNIWPMPKIRFSRPLKMARIDLHGNWIIPKAPLLRYSRLILAIILLALMAGAGAGIVPLWLGFSLIGSVLFMSLVGPAWTLLTGKTHEKSENKNDAGCGIVGCGACGDIGCGGGCGGCGG